MNTIIEKSTYESPLSTIVAFPNHQKVMQGSFSNRNLVEDDGYDGMLGDD